MKRKEIESGPPRRPVSELPARFRPIFPFVSFNHVQSMVFETVLNTNQPIVVSAPTGSGKTGVFEMAIIKMLMDAEQRKAGVGSPKTIYLAPTKALCAERREDWYKKFKPFNMDVIELTSDVLKPTNFKDSRRPTIIVATPEKWDSITRNWSGHKAFVQSIRLLLVDEIHLINDGSRGATLEAVISRMKTIRSSMWPTEQDNLRFLAASATISNVNDIAEWFSTPQSKAQVYQVSPQDRPVKLKTIVLGYTTNKDVNEFSFDSLLNYKLAQVIKDYSDDKPTLIFCATRKSCSTAASVLVKEGKFDLCFSTDKRKQYLALSKCIKDKILQETTRFGVAFHHAGLSASDRKLIESGFIDGSVMILCCTSTLAMGVNLPAHLVIIKNTSYFDEGTFKPYTESSLVQMIGRAGRPQYDTSATAVIMTKSYCREEFEKMLSGTLVVESQLHKHLTEHLNSEIVLGTVTDETIARKWIDATFLCVRLMKAPQNYGLPEKSCKAMKESTIAKWCGKSIEMLVKHGMAVRTDQRQLQSTEVGRTMARHYVSLETTIVLTNLLGTETQWDLLNVICSCQEITGDIQVRNEDKPLLTSLNNPKDERHKLRYSLTDDVYSRERKANALIQATLGNLTLTHSTLLQEAGRIMRNADRILSCLRDIVLQDTKAGYKLFVNVMIMCQCFAAKLWEDSPFVSKQLEKIGGILSHNLADNGLTSFDALCRANPRNIELFCNRLPPFGSNVQQTCLGLPRYDMRIDFRTVPGRSDKIQLMVEITMINGQDLRQNQSLPPSHQSVVVVGNTRDNRILFRYHISDALILNRADLKLFYGTDIDKTELPGDGDKIEGHIMSEMFVGLNRSIVVAYKEPSENKNSSAWTAA